jgi:type IV secretion system protein VirB9
MPLAIALSAPDGLAQDDPRMVMHVYDASEIVKIHGRLGVQATISFAENELIENVAVGDSQKWQITPNKRANLLFVKPLEASAVTNMTVVTNMRTYLFDLVASTKERPVYMFQFAYGDARPPAAAPAAPIVASAPVAATTRDRARVPADSVAVAAETRLPVAAAAPRSAVDEAIAAPAQAAQDKPAKVAKVKVKRVKPEPEEQPVATAPTALAEPAIASAELVVPPAEPGSMNFAWGRKGPAELYPARIFDDGAITYVTWNPKQTVPVVTIANGKGEEGPARYTVRGETMFIESVPVRIILRSDKDSATLDNLRATRSSILSNAVAADTPRLSAAADPLEAGRN